MFRTSFRWLFFPPLFFLCAIFAWRIYYYYQKIEAGTLTSQDLSFTSHFTPGNLLSASRAEDGLLYDLATEDDPSLGPAHAPLVIVEFGDFGCPYSAEASHTIRRLASLYPDAFRYVYRDFPLTDLHRDAFLAARAGECADVQEGFWPFYDKLYLSQEDLSREALLRYAEEVGLDTELFLACLDSSRYSAEVMEDFLDGQSAGVYGTPTFFLNGVRVEGAIPEALLEEIILSL
jgi:protein-disulfide isomerase